MKRNYLMASMLAIAAAFSGCSQDEEYVNTNTSQTYQASVFVSKGDITEVIESEGAPGTRAVFVGGNTNRFATLWDKDDVVQVYKDGNNVGSLSLNDAANEKYQGTKDAYLTGTLTGNFAVGDNLELYLPAKARSYMNQDGTINGLSANFSYQKQTVQVDEVSGSGEQKTIKLKKANMDHRQAYMRLRLRDNNDKLLHPSQVTISTTSGSANQLVAEVGEDGTTMTYADGGIVINTVEVNHEYPGEIFVALLDGGYNESTHKLGGATYHITAIVDGIAYTANSDFTWTFTNGALTDISRKMSMAESTMTMASQMKILQGSKKTRVPQVKVGDVDVTDKCTFTYTSDNYSVAWVNSKTGEVTAVGTPGSTATITVTSSAPYAATKTYTVTVTAPVPATADNYVDLGLPSGTKWAKMNVGATSETDFGTYFAWGETEGWTSEYDYDKDNFILTTYKWCNGSLTTNTKYVTSDKASSYGYNGFYDDKTKLDPEDDAATQNWGSDWCMPTETQIRELIDNTDREWAIINGINICKLMKKTDHDIYIIIPAGGNRVGLTFEDLGSLCQCWSSTLYTANQAQGRYLDISSNNAVAGVRNRFVGRTVRAVYVGN